MATAAYTLYGERVTKRYKTFPATWKPAGGLIRVVLVDEPSGWRAYFCTDPSATVGDILTAVADRFCLEITYRDRKEIVGARPAAGPVHLGEHRGVSRLPVEVHADRGVGLGPPVDRPGGPLGLAAGFATPPAEPRGQVARVAHCAAGRGESCSSTPRGD
jgi:hypothetical protein